MEENKDRYNFAPEFLEALNDVMSRNADMGENVSVRDLIQDLQEACFGFFITLGKLEEYLAWDRDWET